MIKSWVQLLLVLSVLNTVLLTILGGARFTIGNAKIEWGTLGPWAGLMIVVVMIAARFYPDLFNILECQFKEFTEKTKPWVVLVTVGFLAWIAHVSRQVTFTTHMFDMGFVNQAILNPFWEGRWLAADLSPKGSYLVDHFSPTLLFASAFTAWSGSNILVFTFQAVLMVAGVLFLLRSVKLERSYLALAALLFVCHQGWRNAIVWDVREDLFAFFFMCTALWALSLRKRALFFISLVLFLFSKEHLGVLVLPLVIPILFDRSLPYSKIDRRISALVILGVGIGHAYLVNKVINPYLNQGLVVENVSNIVLRYGEFGKTPSEVIFNLATQPSNWLKLLGRFLGNAESYRYLVQLLLPLILFLVRSPYWIAAASMGILMNLGGDNQQKSLRLHYDLALIPFLFFGTLQGMKAIAGTVSSDFSSVTIRRRGLWAVGLALLVSGRWPMYRVWEVPPTVTQIQDYLFFSRVDCSGPDGLAVNGQLIPQFTRCNVLRGISFENECQVRIGDTSRIPGRTPYQAKTWVLDSNDVCEKKILAGFQSTPEKIEQIQASPSGRYWVIRRKL